jgi:hypothetical protein
VAGAAAIAAIAGTGVLVARTRRSRRRTWLEVQLARLEERTGVRIDDSVTLPRWLEQLPPDDRDAFEGVVRALEYAAWAAEPLDEDDRRWVEKTLIKSR